MFLISNKGSTDAAVNLALEEYCVRGLDPNRDYLLFYVNDPAIIIGAHQNPWMEINTAYVRQQGIPVVRRISGGGAVYHDNGNLNFCFITRYRKERFGRFDSFTRPIINALNRLGIPAIGTHGNVIQVRGKKISGNAQFADMQRMFSHGTLLFNADLKTMNRALDSGLSPVESRGVRSIKKDVGNLVGFLKTPMTMNRFIHALQADLSEQFGKIKNHELSENAWADIHKLADRKYRRWKWVYGRTPKFVVRKIFDPGGENGAVLVYIDKGIIQHIENKSDPKDIRIKEAASQLTGCRFSPVLVRRVLKG